MRTIFLYVFFISQNRFARPTRCLSNMPCRCSLATTNSKNVNVWFSFFDVFNGCVNKQISFYQLFSFYFSLVCLSLSLSLSASSISWRKHIFLSLIGAKLPALNVLIACRLCRHDLVLQTRCSYSYFQICYFGLRFDGKFVWDAAMSTMVWLKEPKLKSFSLIQYLSDG